MSTIVSSILRAATRSEGEALNILCMATHEAYETCLAKTGHQFFAFRAPSLKDWNRDYRPVPDNYTLLDPQKGDQQLPPDITFDMVLSQNRLGSPSQFQIAAGFARSLHIPHINLEHCLPHVRWTKGQILSLKELKADYNVFISEYSRDAWLTDASEARVVYHGIDTDLFCPPGDEVVRKPLLLSVVNDWIKRDWCCGFNFWKEATASLPCFVIGDTPGLSEPAKTIGELVSRYQDSMIFVNTSLVSPVPTALLEAMSCGCAVVSTATCMVPEIIEDGYNGFLCSTPETMHELCRELLKMPDTCREIGRNARQTILERFNLGDFIANWNEVFDLAARTLPQVRDKDGGIIVI